MVCNFIALKWSLKFIIIQNSVRNKRCWAVDGAHYAFHENSGFSNLRISKAPSKKIYLAYFYLSELIQKTQFALTDPVSITSCCRDKFTNLGPLCNSLALLSSTV